MKRPQTIPLDLRVAVADRRAVIDRKLTAIRWREAADPLFLVERIGSVEIWQVADEWYVYGVTESGDPRVTPSLGMAREIAAGFHDSRPSSASPGPGATSG